MMFKSLQLPIHRFVFIQGKQVSAFSDCQFALRRLFFIIDEQPEYFTKDIECIMIDRNENITITYKNNVYNDSELIKQLALI